MLMHLYQILVEICRDSATGYRLSCLTLDNIIYDNYSVDHIDTEGLGMFNDIKNNPTNYINIPFKEGYQIRTGSEAKIIRVDTILINNIKNLIKNKRSYDIRDECTCNFWKYRTHQLLAKNVLIWDTNKNNKYEIYTHNPHAITIVGFGKETPEERDRRLDNNLTYYCDMNGSDVDPRHLDNDFGR